MRGALWAFTCVLLFSLGVSLARTLAPVPDPVPDSTWRAVEALIEGEGPHDGLVITQPAWEDGSTGRFQNFFLIQGRPNTTLPLHFPRVWVVLSHGAERPDYLPDAAIPDFERVIDDVRVLRYSHPDADRVKYDFFVRLGEAKVSLRRGEEERRCDRFYNMAWRCPVQEWNNLGRRAVQINDEWDTCLWMHPVKGWATQARFENVPFGARLSGEFALSDEAAEARGLTPVIFSLYVNGEKRAAFQSKPDKGFHRFDLDTSELAGTSGTVIFESAAVNDGLRHFCWRGQTRSDPVGSERFGASPAWPMAQITTQTVPLPSSPQDRAAKPKPDEPPRVEGIEPRYLPHGNPGAAAEEKGGGR